MTTEIEVAKVRQAAEDWHKCADNLSADITDMGQKLEAAAKREQELVDLVRLAAHWHCYGGPPDDRYDDLDDLWQDIEAILASHPVAGRS